MDTGISPGQKECDSQNSWIPTTPFRPIMPKQMPVYVNGQTTQLVEANWLGLDCFAASCSQGPLANSDATDMSNCASNWKATSAAEMVTNRNNNVTCIDFSLDPMDRWKDVPFTDLLSLANAASKMCSNIELVDEGNSNQENLEHDLPIPHQRSNDISFCPGAIANAVCQRTVSEFAPITPDKAMTTKSNQVSQLQNYSYTDDKTNQERDAQDNEIAAIRGSNITEGDVELLQPGSDASVAAATTLFENHNPDKQDGHVIDLNNTPQLKPKRKKHRPKVAKEGKHKTRKPVTPKPAGSGKRKYERRKGLGKDSTCSPAQVARESINPKSIESTKESCRKTLNFDIEGHNREESSIWKSASHLVSESGTKDFHERGIQLKTTTQLGDGIEVTTIKPVTPKPAGSKKNSTGKRKYVRKKGLNTEACRKSLHSEAGKPLDENPTAKRKYVRKKGLNKDSISSPVEVPVEYYDQRTFELIKNSCKRTLNFDIQGQHGDERSRCKSIFNLEQARDSYTGGNQSKSTVQLTEGIELTLENTEVGIAYDLTRSVNQMIKDYMSLTEGQEPAIQLPAIIDPQLQKRNAILNKENNTEGKRQGTDTGQEHVKQIMLQIENQSSPVYPTESTSNNSTILVEPGQAWETKRKSSNTIEQAEASSSNLIGTHYHALQAYQKHWVPKIYKKKRTEKGQHSSTSGTSSSAIAAKYVTLETKCSQGDTKADCFASKTNNSICIHHSNATGIAATLSEAQSNLQDKQNTLEGILALTPTEGPKKKRSKGLTQVRDLGSLTRIAKCTMQPTNPGNPGYFDFNKQQDGNTQRPHNCIELVAEVHETLAQKKRTKKRHSFVNSASPSTSEAQKQQKFIFYNHYQFSTHSLGTLPEVTWTPTFSIDALIERLEHLDINRESSHIEHQKQNALVPYRVRNQEQNALVLYSRDGTIVPFNGSFELARKRRPRPKVELDDETNRVWKLLLENINSQGIDGTDEENTKWWEEERRVFHGRVDSFIARMHLVQGDRRFSPWKGSVVDSVVGVFLTQNVSDHLSSSAFMSLAANFPLKSKNQNTCNGQGTSLVTEEPVVFILDPEDPVEWTEKMSHQPACDQSSMTLHDTEVNEEKEVVSSNESFGSSIVLNSINESKCSLLNSYGSDSDTLYNTILNITTTKSTGTETTGSLGSRMPTNDALSSQNSMMSSQNYMDSSSAPAEKTKSSFVSNSEVANLIYGPKLNGFNDCTSFVELLQRAGSCNLHGIYDHGNGNMSSDENSKGEHDQFQTMGYDNIRQKGEDLVRPKDLIGASYIQLSTFHPYLTQDSAVEVAYSEMFREETESSGIFMKNDKNSVTEQTAVTPEFTSQTTDATKPTVSVAEAPSPSSENKQTSNSMQEDTSITEQHKSELFSDFRFASSLPLVQKDEMQHRCLSNLSGETQDATESRNAFDNQEKAKQKKIVPDLSKDGCSFSKELDEINDATSKPKGRKVAKDKKNYFDWDSLRRQAEANGRKERPENNMDSLDWEAVRCADVNKIANTIKERGMNNMLAERIKDFLNRIDRDHGSIDLEWLRDVPPDKAKEYLLSIRGLGLKSVECVRLLTLHHLAFPVDTNVGRIAVRLGWVPLQPLPESLQLHLLELYPVLESIQKYLWPRLCKLDQRTLYELHYQMITFGKVFCTKSKPNCNACPMRGECRHFASAFASSRLALPGPEERSIVSTEGNRTPDQNPSVIINQLPLPLPHATEQPIGNQQLEAEYGTNSCQPIIEEPATPEPDCSQVTETDIEDTFCEDPDEIPTIKLNMEEFSQTLQNYMQENMELQEGDMSKALVALKAEVASIPTPKLKNVSRLRTEHHVYELPDSHPLLEGLEKRETDDPGRYLLAIWTPGETANSIQPPERRCSSQEHGKLCEAKTCFSCNSVRESQSHIVRGTLLIPCRTAMRGSFPLNGTYFQVNEVFADHDSSLNPINVPREWIWNLPRRTVFFGTSVPTIFKGLTTEGIQHCFWRGYVCVRGFDQKTRAPRPLMARLHFPASKLSKTQGKADAGDK